MNQLFGLGSFRRSGLTLAAICVYLCAASTAATLSAGKGFNGGNSASAVQSLTDSDWEKMLSGEWLIKFYAPWCPACQSLTPVWESLGRRAADMRIKVADVDVTENAALSGRFFVTSLPTIYHVKDGVFRQYKRSRTENDLASFVIDQKWAEVEPVPWYQAPDSYLMMVMGVFFQGSIAIRNLHTSVTTEYGIPVWGSYIMIAVITLLIGLALGLGCVCLCDMLSGHTAEAHIPDDGDGDVEDDEAPDNTEGAGDQKSSPEDFSAEEEDIEDINISDLSDEREELVGEGRGEGSARRRNIPQ